jgi:hypothetical protein
MARHEYWLGVASLRAAQDRLTGEGDDANPQRARADGQQAVRHFRDAVTRDSTLSTDGYYEDVGPLEGEAESVIGIATFASGSEADLPAAARHLRRAVELNPQDAQTRVFLAQALVSDPTTLPRELDEAERLVHQARDFVGGTPPEGFREAIHRVEAHLELRRKLLRMRR